MIFKNLVNYRTELIIACEICLTFSEDSKYYGHTVMSVS